MSDMAAEKVIRSFKIEQKYAEFTIGENYPLNDLHS